MLKFLPRWFSLFLGFTLLFPSLVAAQGSAAFSPDEILVKFKSNVTSEIRQQLRRQMGTTLRSRIDQLDIEDVQVPAGRVEELVAKFKADPRVEYAEPNYTAQALDMTNDPYLVDQTQWGMFKIQAASTSGLSAWHYSTSSAAIKIAIIDTGIDQDHPDLPGSKIVAQRDCTNTSGVDDYYGHGTHVAGIAAAATNNSTGVAGVGYAASLINAKALGDDGSGYYSWIVDCITWAADHDAKVINMSLGAPYKSRALEDAVNYAWSKGVVIAAAAGNSGNSSPTYPAYYTNVIAVAATDVNDVKPSWSSYGKWVDVAAPGVDIYSTTPNHSNYLNTKYPTTFTLNYGYGSGTSMATPHVAGLAALVWSTPFGTTNTAVRKQIEGAADKISGTGKYWQYGRINALKAVH